MKFKEYILQETYINAFTDKDKEIYVDQVWALLQESYKSIGGIKGSGFESKEDMKNKIKLWKLNVENGKVKAGILYKDKNDARKSVAVFTDGSVKSKKVLTTMLKDDLGRSFIEVSHGLLKYMERKLPVFFKKYAIPTTKVPQILGKEITIIDEYHYERNINGSVITKVLLGTGKTFI